MKNTDSQQKGVIGDFSSSERGAVTFKQRLMPVAQIFTSLPTAQKALIASSLLAVIFVAGGVTFAMHGLLTSSHASKSHTETVKLLASTPNVSTPSKSGTTSNSSTVTTTHSSPKSTASAKKSSTTTTVSKASGSSTSSKSAITTKSTAKTTTASSSSGSSSSSSSTPQPSGVPGNWNLIFDDEFSGTSLDTNNWSTGWFGSGITGGVNSSEDDCYDPNQVSVANGELDLTLIQKTETCNGESEPYATGFITTDGKFSYTYGFAEARIWLPGSGSTIADWPSFWQDGQNWPDDGELDIVEGLSGLACGHWHGPSSGSGIGFGGGSGCSSSTFTGGWHTFGADWQANEITYYYDGQDVGSITSAEASDSGNDLVGEPQYLILGLGAASGSNTVAPATERVDYVRVWQE